VMREQVIHPPWTSLLIFGFGALSLLGACTEEQSPPSAPHPTNALVTQERDPWHPAELPFWNLAQLVPSSAGFYRDTASGNIVVLVANPAEDDHAKEVLRSSQARRLARERLMNPQADVVVRRATYRFSQLRHWRDLMLQALDLSGVESVDLDEVGNRVLLGVDSGADRAPIRRLAQTLGVPEAAIGFELDAPARWLTLLTDSVRPIAGGTRLEFTETSSLADTAQCTLGFPALWNNTKAFMTASHCSRQHFQVDSVKQYQPKVPRDSADSQHISPIGFEVADFALIQCPPTIHNAVGCAYADAAVYQFTGPDSDWVLGRVARPSSGCFPGGCRPIVLNISSAFKVTATLDTPMVGDLVSKIGIATGWTQSYVKVSCIDKQSPDPGVYILCLDASDFEGGPGDSGAPILLNINLMPDSSATLGGILSFATNKYRYFGVWAGIAREYPGLVVH